ncbi:putative cytochrome P450 phenylacetate hydroxylase [Aspergillus saccharolyticus JOP 1030-1]|uniref:Putative cytochrome P450 phenylacetate hydroxylase n=1 Tax=Aspergillus saccharolyticus JOP 1030-1 TaxID=1450539 RepID=A0A318ZLD9_9EURO|nr:putative cytochrome P450 phenylacetate hydroxylase [Aspergillus saccharolyticus JOP 1030-1]PYH47697.1 putative cytochrome P450 phenylacetate hydroxylase [Aspergillus saccharolyticus JOP 1030-1]
MAIAAALSLLQTYIIQSPLRTLALLLLTIPITYVILNEFTRASSRVPGLKGPRGLPLIGNLAQIRKNAAEQYRIWSKTYGPVYQIQLGNIPVIVVNSAAAAKTIFGQNAQALSSRPEFYTFHKIVSNTAGTTIGTSPYSESLKRRRKGAASALNRPSVESYVSHLDVETKAFIEELNRYGNGGKMPVDPMAMIQRLSLSLSLTLNWGVRVASQEEDLFDEITHVEEEISKFRSTTGNLQDYIPLLRLNPFNGNSRKAKEMRDRRDRYLNALNRDLDDRMEKGIHKPCIQANVILDKDAKLDTDELISISLTMLSGGLDTITTLVAWSLCLLSQRPDIQDKAAKAIQGLYGQEMPLCDSGDDQKCAYVAALVRECLRYFTVLRLALPRTSIRDITYKKTVIPKGTVFFLNSWACNMDPEVWDDPDEFRPERWLEQPDAPMFTYGMGYRMCAGSLLANRELYLVFMRTLNSFRIEAVEDVDWHPVRGMSDPTSLVAIPRRYRARFVPKDIAALAKSLAQ